MFIFLLQLREYVVGNAAQLYLFAVASALIWLAWVIKVALSRRYRPWSIPYGVGTSVIIPVVDEPEDLFRDVLRRVVEQGPTETVVVINGDRNPVLEAVGAEFPEVVCLWTPVAGKRNAVKAGVENSSQEIVVLVDSDTIWTRYTDVDGEHETLAELVRPFADPRVGGVTTRQRILAPERSWITRWADWLENSRALYSMPAQSVLGQIGCLPGRTIAFRRVILERSMQDFMGEKFLGVFLEVSDDRTLTNYTLKQQYRTVYQSTSLVYTDAPLRLHKLFKQQLRWARGSQYNTLRMLPWMLSHTPVLAFFFLLDIAVPFLLVGAVLGWVYRAISNSGTNFYEPLLGAYPGWEGIAVVTVLMVFSSWLSMLVRQSRHVAEQPGDIWRMPMFIVASTLFMMPVRLLGFVRMAHSASWGTRAGAHSGATASVEGPSWVLDATAGGSGSAEHLDEELDDLLREEQRHGPDGALLVAAPVRPPVAAVSVPPLPQPTPGAPTRRRFNPLALVPYGIASLVLALEALTYV